MKVRGFLKLVAALVAALVLVVTCLLLWSTSREYERRKGLYWHDVERSYDYSFDPEWVTRLAVELESGGILWPESVPCQTALLRVKLTADWSGRWFEPEVRVSTPDLEPFAQHFERGARGTRYLNVSPVCRGGNSAGERISVTAEHAAIEPGASELLLFRDPVMTEGPLLVLAPHPDDAEIAAFGLYQAHESTIVTTTVGDYQNPAYRRLVKDAAEVRGLIGRLRAWDSVAVPMWGGVPPERSLNLGYAGGSLEAMVANPAAEVGEEQGGSDVVNAYRKQNVSSLLRPEATSSWESLVADLAHVLDRTRPAFIAAPHPVLDGASDHRLTTLALLQALERLGDPEAHLLLYDNHHFSSEYWPYGPADSLMTLPPWFGDAKPGSFGSVFSYPLGREARVDKLFALEAMHDLRAPPRAELGDPTMRMLRRVRRTAGELWKDPHLYYSYFRRGPRPNELYFVVAPEGRAALREAAEEALGQ